MSSPRVLLCGDVLGRLALLFKRVSAVNKSNGPFDFLLCVGQFFPDDDGTELVTEFLEFVEGHREVSIPTYFIGGYGAGAAKILAKASQDPSNSGFKNDGVKVCDNLYWLKGSGRFILHGLSISYLSGRRSSDGHPMTVYSEDDIDALRALAEEPGIIDLFLTNEWPQGVLNKADTSDSAPDTLSSAGTDPLVSELASQLKPRYHIAGTKGVFYAREPYTNDGAVHVTRFLGLAAVGNSSKQKFIHAISPTPSCRMSDAEISSKPTNTTLSPYMLIEPQASLSKEARIPAADAQYWRFDSSRKRHRGENEDGKRFCFSFVSRGSCSREDKCDFCHDVEARERYLKGGCFDFIIKGKCEAGQDCKFKHSFIDGDQRCIHDNDMSRKESIISRSSHCWFCLSSPNLEFHLILSVGDAFYCTLPKGQLVQDHVLLVPIEHVPSTISVLEDAERELFKFKSALRAYFRNQGMTIICYEQFSSFNRTTHANLQVVPLPVSKVSDVQKHFISAAKRLEFEFSIISPANGVVARKALRSQVDGNTSFFYVELDEGTILFHSIEDRKKFPTQFGREVLANTLNQKDRVDWRKCTLNKEEETQSAADFKKRFEEFDPTK